MSSHPFCNHSNKSDRTWATSKNYPFFISKITLQIYFTVWNVIIIRVAIVAGQLSFTKNDVGDTQNEITKCDRTSGSIGFSLSRSRQRNLGFIKNLHIYFNPQRLRQGQRQGSLRFCESSLHLQMSKSVRFQADTNRGERYQIPYISGIESVYLPPWLFWFFPLDRGKFWPLQQCALPASIAT